MRALTLVFGLMAALGILTGNWAVFLLAALWGGLCIWASGSFASQDRAYMRDPRSAAVPSDSGFNLAFAEAECNCIQVPAELADLELANRLANANEKPD